DAGILSESNTPDAAILGLPDGGVPATDCDGVMPSSLPPPIWNSTPLSLDGDGQAGCGLPVANGHGTVVLSVDQDMEGFWQIVRPTGESYLERTFWSGGIYAQPAGFIGHEGDSTLNIDVAVVLNDDVYVTGFSPRVLGNAYFTGNPNGGLF